MGNNFLKHLIFQFPKCPNQLPRLLPISNSLSRIVPMLEGILVTLGCTRR